MSLYLKISKFNDFLMYNVYFFSYLIFINLNNIRTAVKFNFNVSDFLYRINIGSYINA